MDIFKITILAFSLVSLTLYILFFEQFNSYFLSFFMIRGIEMVPTKCPDYWKETKKFYDESGYTNSYTNANTTQVACHVTNGDDALPVNSGRCNYVARPDGKGYYDKSAVYGIPNYCDMSYNTTTGGWAERWGYPDKFVTGWRDFFPNPPFIHKAIISIMPNNYYTAPGLLPSAHITSRINYLYCAPNFLTDCNSSADKSSLDSLKIYRIGLWELRPSPEEQPESGTGNDLFFYIKSGEDGKDLLDSTKSFSYTGKTDENTHTSFDYDDSSILINNYDYTYVSNNTTNIYDPKKAHIGNFDKYLGTSSPEPSKSLYSNTSLYYKSLYTCDTSIDGKTYSCPTTFRTETNKLSRDTNYLFVYLMDIPERLDSSINLPDSVPPSNEIKQPIISIKDHLTNEPILHKQGTPITTTTYICDSGWLSTGFVKTTPDGTENVDTALSYFMHKWNMDSTALGIGAFSKDVFNIKISNSTTLLENITNRTIFGYVTFKTDKYDPSTSSNTSMYNQTRAGYPVSTFDKMSSCQKYLWAKEQNIEWHGITNNPLMKTCNKYSYQEAGKVYVGSVYQAGEKSVSDLTADISANDGAAEVDALAAAEAIVAAGQDYSEGQDVMNALGLF